MANEEHLRIIKQGAGTWNKWSEKNPKIRPDLFEADLSDVNLSKANLFWADLREADLRGASLSGADLTRADLTRADLSGAKLSGACLSEADLTRADLTRADLSGAKLSKANLSYANLSDANLMGAQLLETNLEQATLTGCYVYGISAWGTNLNEVKDQSNLVITPDGEPTITVDNIEVAQFIYLLLNNKKVRDAVNTTARKVVLILGSFPEERRTVLDAIREKLRSCDYLPVLFDFEKPATRNILYLLTILAQLSRFIIADLTESKSVPTELAHIVPTLPSIPVQPLLKSGSELPGMFDAIKDYAWVLEIHEYDSPEYLIASLKKKVIDPAVATLEELKLSEFEQELEYATIEEENEEEKPE